MKKILVLVLGICVIFSLVGCSKNTNSKTTTPKTQTVTTTQTTANTNAETKVSDLSKQGVLEETQALSIIANQDSIRNYENCNQLAMDSNNIIEGTSVETKIDYGTYGIFTLAKIKVTNSIYGNMKTGDSVDLRVLGGTISGDDSIKYKANLIKEKFGTVNVSKIKPCTIEIKPDNNIDNLKVGDSFVFYLQTVNDKVYVTGGFMGRFKENNDTIQLNTEFKKSYKDTNKNNFITHVKDSAKQAKK